MTTSGLLCLALSASAESFAECSVALRADPQSRSAARCFLAAAERSGKWDEAASQLVAAQAAFPESGWLPFYLGEVLSRRQRPTEALVHYRSAVDKFVARSDATGEAEARINGGMAELNTGNVGEAWVQAPLALEAARRTGDSLLAARSMLYEAFIIQRTGARLARGIRVLREAEALVFPDGPYAYKSSVLGMLGTLSLDLGRYDHALSYHSARMELAREQRDDATVLSGAQGAITARRKQLEELPEPGRLAELTDEARKLVALADAVGRPALQAIANRTLGDLLTALPETRPAAERYYRIALQQARQAKDPRETSTALFVLGRFLADTRLDESRRLIDESLKLALELGSGTGVAYASRERMRLAWKSSPREEAARVSLEALRASENLRVQQDADVTRATVHGAWALDYHWLIGKLLDHPSPSPADLSVAFEVGERMRARLLLDALERQPSDTAGQPAEVSSNRQQLLRQIAEVQKRLLDPRLPADSRTAAVAELERLEREEASVRHEGMAGGQSGSAAGFASLDSVEGALRDDEAMLTFTVGLWKDFYNEFAGGAWLLVSTKAGTKVFQAPDRARLRPILSIFRGLTEHADTVDVHAAAKLYELLLASALPQLPQGITRLITISDGPVHHLPFAALKASPDAPPLGIAYKIALVPSATVWLRSRQLAGQLASDAVLVFADPALPESARRTRVAEERGWWTDALQVGRLPHSRREGRAAVSRLGGASRVLAGADATEADLKSRDLSRYGILHFATHSLVDETYPERSAVLLTGGPNGEDGLLQPREIADLRLTGQIVVLSSCRSATGAVLAGEGVVGLSHAFLQAGARAVIGTLWPIRDDHAATFFDAFYASLRLGSEIGSALTDARRHAIERGLPASVWASVVVIGDDTARIPAKPLAWWNTPGVTTGIGLLVLATLLAGAIGRRRRTARARATPGAATQG